MSSLARSTKAGDRKERTAVKTTSSSGNGAVLGLIRKAKARNTIEQELLAASKTCSLRHLSIHISCEEDLVLFLTVRSKRKDVTKVMLIRISGFRALWPKLEIQTPCLHQRLEKMSTVMAPTY